MKSRPFRRLLLACILASLFPALGGRAQEADPAWQEARDYLIQSVCVGGDGRVLPGVSPLDGAACPRQRKIGVGERLPYHKQDWAPLAERDRYPDGIQRSDSVPIRTALGLAVLQTYDFGDAPRRFGSFDEGDGGQVAFFTPNDVAFGLTEDGGAGLQFFLGPDCRPVDSWVVVDRSFAIRTAGESLARITRRQDRCPQRLGTAATRWSVRPVSLPVRSAGRDATVTFQTLVSEHYSRAAVAQSDSLERMYFTRELGYTRWERWQNLGVSDRAQYRREATRLDGSGRCAPGLGEPPEGGPWVMTDCRQWTQMVPPDAPGGDLPSFWLDRLQAYPETRAIFGPP